MNANKSYIPSGYDPVTLEVLRMRLDSIVEEMGSAMIRSSGSPTITESGDFNTALFDPEGRIYSYSDAVQFHIGSGSVAVQNLVKEIAGEPLHPGDAFICNDPHTAGSAHPPDSNVISPIFLDEELVGWAQSQAHLVDVGGMTAGGFAPGAYDCYSEGLRLPPGVKIFEKGEPVNWVRRVLLNNVRVPVLFWNDVRSLVASNNTGIRRLQATIEEIGLDTFRDYTRVNFEVAERVVRERISSLVDGVYEGDEWTEHNGHVDELYRVHCKMTVSEGQIDMDFAGSSPQTDGFINLSYGTLVGSVASAFVPILAWDVPFNEGVMTACLVAAEEGSLVNPLPPAPISNGHLTTGARVSRLVTKLLNEAARNSPDERIRRRSQGVWADSWTGGISAGTRDSGEFFVLFNMDGGGMGTGAQPVVDGLDCGGMMTQVNNSLPDVEMNEMLYPVLYLWKRLNTSSTGHGGHRGGQGHEFAWRLHGASQVTQTVFAPSSQVVADGFGGAYPGGGSGHAVWRSTNIAELLDSGVHPTDETLTASEHERLEINQQGVVIDNEDVFVQWVAGGGGYGDPILRNQHDVARDVADGYLSPDIASDVYGVVISANGSVEESATDQRRRQIRQERLGSDPRLAVSTTASPEHSAPRRDENGWYCPASAARLEGEEWRDGAILRTSMASERLSEIGTRVRARTSNPDVLLDEFISPECGTLLETRVRVAA